MSDNRLITCKELQQMLGIGESKAYALIRQMNAELEEKGYISIKGKVPVKYVNERFYF